MKDTWYHILISVADRDLHGHGMIRKVLDDSEGQLRLWPVTLYSSIDDLVEQGWIRELGNAERPPNTSAKRRYFRLTQSGRRVLADEAIRRQAIAERALRLVNR